MIEQKEASDLGQEESTAFTKDKIVLVQMSFLYSCRKLEAAWTEAIRQAEDRKYTEEIIVLDEIDKQELFGTVLRILD